MLRDRYLPHRADVAVSSIGSYSCGAAIVAMAAFLPPPFDALVAASAATYSAEAAIAAANGKCIKIKSYGAAGQYSGGFCK